MTRSQQPAAPSASATRLTLASRRRRQTGERRVICDARRCPPAVLQVESHPYLTQTNLIRFAEAHGVHVTAFSPLGSAGYVEMGWTTEDEGAINEPVVREAAARRGATPGQILLRWATQRGTSAIPKTTKEERLVENIAVFDETRGFDLTPEEMAAIEALNRGKRYNDPAEFCPGMGGLSPIYD